MSLRREAKLADDAAALMAADLHLHEIARQAARPRLVGVALVATLERAGASPWAAGVLLGETLDLGALEAVGQLATAAPGASELWLRIAARQLEAGPPTARGRADGRLAAWSYGVNTIDAAREPSLRRALDRHRWAVRGEHHLGLLAALRRGLTTNELAALAKARRSGGDEGLDGG